MTITDSLSWSTHIEQTCVKANRVLGLIKRVCGRDIIDETTRKLMYITLVCPILEYASSLWSPYTAKHHRLLENIQRRATRFIMNYPDRDAYPYSERLIKLKLLPLEYRRESRDLILFFKIRSGLINANFNHLVFPITSRYMTRHYHPSNFRPITTHTQLYFIQSFFPRSIKLWNNLSSELKQAKTIKTFKHSLLLHYIDKMDKCILP